MDLHDLTTDTPIPAVSADDLVRVWRLYAEIRKKHTREADASEPFSISVNLVAAECSPGANVYAVFVRQALVQALTTEFPGAEWHQGGEPRQDFFALAAEYPLPRGIGGFDPAEFIRALDSPPPRS